MGTCMHSESPGHRCLISVVTAISGMNVGINQIIQLTVVFELKCFRKTTLIVFHIRRSDIEQNIGFTN